MSLKALASRARKSVAPAPDHAAALERAQREASAARARTERAEADAVAARKEVADEKAARARQDLESRVSAAAAQARALNPAHVVALTRDRYEIVDGKVRSKADPAKDLDADMGEWLASEGKHFLPAQVPSGGSGAPGTTVAPAAAAPHDLKTQQGRDAAAREINARLSARPS